MVRKQKFSKEIKIITYEKYYHGEVSLKRIAIINLFREEKYRCSAEGHISHILSARLSSRPMGWSVIGADEMARMGVYKANGGSIKEYYRNFRAERKKEERILELDKKVVKDIKRTFNTTDPDIMIDMPYTYRTDGRWPKNMLNCSGF